MGQCTAQGCKNHSGYAPANVTFHRFPKDEALRKKWTAAVGRRDWIPMKWSCVCSVHFHESDIDRTSLVRVRIREGAVPTIFTNLSSPLEAELAKDPSNEGMNSEQDHTLEEGSFINQDSMLKHTMNAPICHEGELQIQERKNINSKTFEMGTPRKLKLKRKIEDLTEINEMKTKKIKLLQQKSRRQMKQNAKMKNIISELRKRMFLEQDTIDILENLGGANKEILKRQIAKVKGNPAAKKYTSELRSFAMTLHFYSPKAYNYVRTTFDTCLPHPQTLCKWYKCVDGSPGFNNEILGLLTHEAQSAKQYPLICNLLIDGMAVRQQIEWDGTKYYGYVDMGTNLNDDCLPVAKEAIVFMLVCINKSWKLPVGYFLVDGISGLQLSNLVKQCLILVEKTGIKVVSLTFDGAACNMSMAKHLGCSFDTSKSLLTSFQHPSNEEKVFVFLDPCHMLKLVRNTLGEKKCIVDSENQLIKWNFIMKLQELQDAEGLHLSNKLRKRHLEWFRQKMSVKLAAQLMSASVADAIEECQSMGLKIFENSEATVKFLRHINCIFDILNSRNIHQPGWKKPLCPQNFQQVNEYLRDAIKYLFSLKTYPEKIPLISTNRRTGFLGFIICAESFMGLYSNIMQCSEPAISYLPAYKISQDHIELFFSLIRARGGWNNNPTVRQFMSAYKRIIIHNELKESSKGNCMPLENIKILQASSSTYSEPCCVINTSLEKNILELENENHLHDHDYFCATDPAILTEYKERIIVYIAGFVVRKLKIKLKCLKCIDVLEDYDENYSCYSLMKQKLGQVCFHLPKM